MREADEPDFKSHLSTKSLQRRLSPCTTCMEKNSRAERSQELRAMSGVDYVSLGHDHARPPLLRNPLRVAMGLAGLAVTGWGSLNAAKNRLFRSEAKSGEGHAAAPFVPEQGVKEVVAEPGPPGLIQAIGTGLHPPHCLFLYGDMERDKTLSADSFLKGADVVEGWLYGGKLSGKNHAYATGNPSDVLKGNLVCWPKGRLDEKLKITDKMYKTKELTRGVASVVKREGSIEKAYWYHEAPPLMDAVVPAPQHIMPKEDDRSIMDSVRGPSSPSQPITIVVVGASGDLAKKKTFPALFSLFYHGLLPPHFQIVGFARRDMGNQEFRDMITGSLTCRVIDGERCARKMEQFIPYCFYIPGQYDSLASFQNLSKAIAPFEKAHAVANRMFYLAVPPSVFEPACSSISHGARAHKGWTRVVIEKPFGRDLESYEKLQASLSRLLTEDEIYRIDHYLGKELVQNLMTLRFANSVFEPLWNRHYIESVQIVFKEPFGVEGRAGYFNDIGIVRDIMQNHLLQVLALIGMEVPVSLHSEDIRNEKVKLLRNIKPLTIDDFVLGQYKGKDKSPGYLDDEGVPANSRTPTFAACHFSINNRRWDGVPFLMKAGKALDERKAEIRVQFKAIPGDIFAVPSNIRGNQLVLRVQPDEAIYLKIVSKAPGLTSRLEEARLNLFYRTAWEESRDIPDAYERLILDVILGEKSLFIRNDELEVAWKIFDHALAQMENDRAPKPEPYNYGSRGPLESDFLAFKLGVKWLEERRLSTSSGSSNPTSLQQSLCRRVHVDAWFYLRGQCYYYKLLEDEIKDQVLTFTSNGGARCADTKQLNLPSRQ
eukprot:g40784.t1